MNLIEVKYKCKKKDIRFIPFDSGSYTSLIYNWMQENRRMACKGGCSDTCRCHDIAYGQLP